MEVAKGPKKFFLEGGIGPKLFLGAWTSPEKKAYGFPQGFVFGTLSLSTKYDLETIWVRPFFEMS